MFLTVLWIRIRNSVGTDPDLAGFAINWTPGSVVQDYGSADPDPKEIFTDPQYWFLIRTGFHGPVTTIFF